jgi:valine--pyruvate aminotransferase
MLLKNHRVKFTPGGCFMNRIAPEIVWRYGGVLPAKNNTVAPMTFSLFGDKFTRYAGITRLMDDLNEGLRTPGAIMLGGGNPAQIPEMESYFKQLCQDMLDQGKLTEALCNYDGPQGKDAC